MKSVLSVNYSLKGNLDIIKRGRLLNYTRLSALDSSDFFASPVTQQLKLQNQINIAMNKISCRQIFAGMLGQNFSETVKSFTSKGDVSYLQISVPPAYCKKFIHEVLTIIELGFPIFFMILKVLMRNIAS